MIEVDPPTLSGARFEEILGADGWRKFDANLIEAGHCLSGRTIWHVNSTMTGGGVAELLTSAVGYLRGASIATRWKVIGGHDEFFAVTKRIHHMLHGKRGDGGGLGEGERAVYDAVLDKEGAELTCEITAGDVVVLHDPQVAGLAPRLSERGAVVIWNCHVGADVSNTYTQQAWRFLASAVRVASMTVFSRKSYVWDNLDPTKVAVIPPCIDAFSPKNQDLAGVGAALSATGIIPSAHEGQATFTRTDGSAAAVISRAEMLEARPVPQDAMVVSQVSRWDPLKDHAGLAQAFCAHKLASSAHLILAGPSPDAISDDPEGRATLGDLRSCVESLPSRTRDRVHVACLPMDDIEENGAIVNALQRRSQIVVQKSLAEGFGLTVTEAMWKARPVVASAVGGIQDQIQDGRDGVLVDDASDLSAFASSIAQLLTDRSRAEAMGLLAHESVLKNYLMPTYLERYLALIVEHVRT